eukprot:3833485-Ditylum_brightwellii.AAC.1
MQVTEANKTHTVDEVKNSIGALAAEAVFSLGSELTPILGACLVSCVLGAQDAGCRAGQDGTQD